ncbi:hypothetical protein HanPI659440_Chr17g0677921 [Helianthus annuus]|nr:hypothetical protein HanPI659440_Chr17g0677921 [Helianthus annuus]
MSAEIDRGGGGSGGDGDGGGEEKMIKKKKECIWCVYTPVEVERKISGSQAIKI